jgi:hypothetical protein
LPTGWCFCASGAWCAWRPSEPQRAGVRPPEGSPIRLLRPLLGEVGV